MMHAPQSDPQAQLAAVDAAPDLRRSASGRERTAGVVSLVVLYGMLYAAMAARVSVWVGLAVYVVAFAMVLAWRSHHLDAARRRPHTRVENGLQFLAAVYLAFPASTLLFGEGPRSTAGHLVTAAIPTVLTGAYLVSRWRK
ncbi:hypothetical protein ABT160_07710 [Streptomyces sp. NPDC001941]|uniref:hypothetical protein n=1 Tax=Streptomyces sp. NPDC001941 TaxID=3154659 RepID=UPI00331FD898